MQRFKLTEKHFTTKQGHKVNHYQLFYNLHSHQPISEKAEDAEETKLQEQKGSNWIETANIRSTQPSSS